MQLLDDEREKFSQRNGLSQNVMKNSDALGNFKQFLNNNLVTHHNDFSKN